MSLLAFRDPKTTDLYREHVVATGVALPLSASTDDIGSVVDAEEQPVFVVDVNREWSDEKAFAVASWIVLAVNTCAGFKARRGR